MKKILSLLLAVMMVFSVSASAKTLEFTINKKTAYDSAEKIEAFEIENAPYTKNSRTMVPVRVISEKFGADVEWIEASSQVVITTPEKSITLTLGSCEAVVNGEKVILDVAPEEFNGRTMVPLRFISENLGMKVEYIPSTQQILITDNKIIMKIGETDIYYDDFVAALTISDYSLEEHYVLGDGVDYACDAFIELYGSAEYLNSLGVFPLETYSNEIGNAIIPNEEVLRKSTLIAPVAKLLAADCFITDYVITYLESDEALDKALSIYENEFVTAKHILFLCDDTNKADVKKTAQETLKKLKSGADFDTLMNELSEDPGLIQYPDGYTFTYGEMVKEFEDASFALKEGEMSELVETSYGYHIIKREPLAKVDPALSNYLLQILASRIYQQVIDESKQNIKYEIFMDRKDIIDLMKK
ncbi:MAG: peptidylprolyl isomerase [Clostridia bacterium]|nr:peptidylprolyl isomerase [Clostridia bacterium]